MAFEAAKVLWAWGEQIQYCFLFSLFTPRTTDTTKHWMPACAGMTIQPNTPIALSPNCLFCRALLCGDFLFSVLTPQESPSQFPHCLLPLAARGCGFSMREYAYALVLRPSSRPAAILAEPCLRGDNGLN